MGSTILLLLLSSLCAATEVDPQVAAPQDLQQVMGQESERPKVELPKPDATLQRAIRECLQVDPGLTAAQRRAELDALEALAGDDFQTLIPQLFLFSRAARSTREAMAFGMIASRLRIPDGSVLRALVPLLEIQEAQLQADLAGYLSEYEGASASRRPSFDCYRDFLSTPLARGDSLPKGLTRYLFERDAGQAVLLLMSVSRATAQEQRRILWAEHTLSEVLWQEEHDFREAGAPDAGAARELNRMALHSAWYARYYAAEVLGKAPHLGQRAWLETLSKDADPRVRAAAERHLQPR